MSMHEWRGRAKRVEPHAAMLFVLLLLVVSMTTMGAQQAASGASAASRKSGTSAAARKGPPGPGLGKPATSDQVASADVSIGPDGAGLPPGSGTPSQGEAIFNTK